MRALGRVVLSITLMLCVLGFTTLGQQDVLTVAMFETVRGGDPQNHTATYTAAIHQLVFDTLIGRDAENNYIPRLALSWETAENQRDWIFHLREGVTFHDGTPFNAEAVKFTFDRLLDPGNALAVRGRYAAIKDVTVIDQYTVRFSFDKAFGPFLELMAESGANIIGPTAMEKLGAESFTQDPVGTGPYVWLSWTRGEKLELVRNDAYWGTLPSIKRIEVVPIIEETARVAALEKGDVDFVMPLPPQAASQLEADSEVRVLAEPSTRVYWCTLNTRIPILENQRVRQALNYAIDYDALVQGLFFGYAQPNNSPIAPGCFGYSEYTVGYDYNPDLAKRLLEEAGYPEGFAMTLWVPEMRSRVAEAIAAYWGQIGVACEVEIHEEGVHYQMLGEPLETTKVQADIDTWSSYDAFTGIGPLLHGKNLPPNGINWAFYSNPMVNDLLDKAENSTDQQERLELYRQAQQIIMSDAPWIVITIPFNLAGVRANLHGVWLEPGGLFHLEGAWFE